MPPERNRVAVDKDVGGGAGAKGDDAQSHPFFAEERATVEG